MRLLTPIPVDRRPRRFIQLIVGLLLYGITMGMMVRAVLGLDPWDVFHQGLTALINQWVPLSYGTVITIMSVIVLLLWIPLRQRPGVGTIANAAIIGFTTDATLRLLPEFSNLTVRIVVLALAIVGNALAGALYIGAGLGPGPRDGLMTGIVARGIGSIRLVRTTIELTVLGHRLDARRRRRGRHGRLRAGHRAAAAPAAAPAAGALGATAEPVPVGATSDAPFTEAEGR